MTDLPNNLFAEITPYIILDYMYKILVGIRKELNKERLSKKDKEYLVLKLNVVLGQFVDLKFLIRMKELKKNEDFD